MLQKITSKSKQLFSYYIIQQKTAFSYIPKLILCMLVFALLLSGFAFAGSKLLYNNQSNVAKVKIALVTEDDNPLIDLAVHYVGNMNSVDSICEFQILDENTAFNKLKHGELYAVVYLPPGFIKGILNGSNTPAEITLHPDSGADSVLFETLADAAAYTLRTAQAGIYAAIDTFKFYELDGVKTVTNDLNEIYIDAALGRAKMFDEEAIDAIGGLSIITFYIASAFVLLLLFSGIGCAAFYKSNNAFLCKIINRSGIGYLLQIILQGLAMSVCYFIIFCIPYLLYSYLVIEADFIEALLYCPLLFIMIFGICEFVLLIFRMAKNPHTGVLLLFFISVILLFLSGGILPKAFLPIAVQKLAAFLPSTHWLSISFDLFAGSFSGVALTLHLMATTIFILINYLITRLENR